jgi:AraC-like DNA-binding protein
VYHRAIVANDEGKYHARRSSIRDSDRILKILSDKIFQKILLSTIDSAKTVTEICLENNIPVSSTYRKVQKLQEIGFIYIERIHIDKNRRRTASYRSKIKSVSLTFSREGINFQLAENKPRVADAS